MLLRTTAGVFTPPLRRAYCCEPRASDTDSLSFRSGNAKRKQLKSEGRERWHNLTTLDIDPLAKPDVIWDLRK